MNKYVELITDFEQSMMRRTGKFGNKEYMLVVGDQEFFEMTSICDKASAKELDGRFDGKFYGFDTKRLHTPSAFTIIKKQDYTEMVKLIKREMISLLPRVRLVAEID